jgi:Protein required for attachment to host cells
MKNTLVLVTDFRGFKAYRLENETPHSSPRLELLEEYTDTEAHRHLVEQVSDQSGRFPRRTGGARSGGAMSDGERHNITLERRKRGVRKLAGLLDDLLMKNPEVDQCLLAASREIMNPLLQELSARSRSKIGVNIPSDLMKASKVELLRQFGV